jgi:hypothetical protein
MLLIPKRILQSVKKNNTSAVCHVKFITLTDFLALSSSLPSVRPQSLGSGPFASVAKRASAKIKI